MRPLQGTSCCAQPYLGQDSALEVWPCSKLASLEHGAAPSCSCPMHSCTADVWCLELPQAKAETPICFEAPVMRDKLR